MPHARLRALLPVLAVLALSACSGGSGTDSSAVVSSGDPASCPGDVVEVAVSVGQWSDIARRLGGACATVTTIASVSPRDAEPVAADLATLAGADLVLLNGAGYDDWAVGAAGSDPVVVSAAEVARTTGPDTDRPDTDPHLWNDPAVVPAVAQALARELGRLSPDAAPYFDAQHTTWTTELVPYLETVNALRAQAAGRRYAATDPVFDRMTAAIGLTDVTPPDYRRAGRSGSPSPDDAAALESDLREGGVDVLIRDGGADGEVRDQVREVAEDADVPVVDVTEFPAEDASFVEWQLDQLADLAAALAELS